MVNRSKRGLGEILLESGIITSSQLEEALIKQKTSGKRLGEILIAEGIINEKQLIEALEYQLKIPYFDFTTESIQPEIPRLISESLAGGICLYPSAGKANN